MEPKIKVDVIREKSFDPTFFVKVSYDTDSIHLSSIPVWVERRAPRVTFDFPAVILETLNGNERAKLELAIMNRLLEFIMYNTERDSISSKPLRI